MIKLRSITRGSFGSSDDREIILASLFLFFLFLIYNFTNIGIFLFYYFSILNLIHTNFCDKRKLFNISINTLYDFQIK